MVNTFYGYGSNYLEDYTLYMVIIDANQVVDFFVKQPIKTTNEDRIDWLLENNYNLETHWVRSAH